MCSFFVSSQRRSSTISLNLFVTNTRAGESEPKHTSYICLFLSFEESVFAPGLVWASAHPPRHQGDARKASMRSGAIDHNEFMAHRHNRFLEFLRIQGFDIQGGPGHTETPLASLRTLKERSGAIQTPKLIQKVKQHSKGHAPRQRRSAIPICKPSE